MVARVGDGIVREIRVDVHTRLYLKWITSKGLLFSTGILLNVTWQPGWEWIWGRTDTWTCMLESLCCPPETITTVLISYTPTHTHTHTVVACVCVCFFFFFF